MISRRIFNHTRSGYFEARLGSNLAREQTGYTKFRELTLERRTCGPCDPAGSGVRFLAPIRFSRAFQCCSVKPMSSHPGIAAMVDGVVDVGL